MCGVGKYNNIIQGSLKQTHTQINIYTFTKTHTHLIEIENGNMISCRKIQKNVA